MNKQEAMAASGAPLREVETELCDLAGQIASATSRFLSLVADFDRRRGWEGVNIRSCAHWLSWRCGLSLRTAHEQVRVARALVQLPLIRAAFDAGRLSYSKVRAIARVATAVSEKDLLDAALHSPASHVERLVRGLRTAQRGCGTNDAEDADEQGLTPLPSERDRHRVTWYWDLDGDLVISGRLGSEDGAHLLAAISRAQAAPEATAELPAEPMTEPRTESKAGPRTETGALDDGPGAGSHAEVPSQRSAEPSSEPGPGRSAARPSLMRAPSDLTKGLVTMAQMICAGLPAPRFAPAATVHVTVDLRTLREAFAAAPGPSAETDAESSVDLNRGARLDDGPSLAASCLRRLADDGRINLDVLASDGRILEVGRSRRTPSESQLRALWRRDRGCAVPGCDRTRFLHAHHVVFWSHGGATELDNLLLLCGNHHRSLHEGRFRIRALGRQRFEFVASRGTLEPAPAVQGSVADLGRTFGSVESQAIVPDWDGTPLYGWAISAYLAAWRTSVRRSAAEVGTSGESERVGR